MSQRSHIVETEPFLETFGPKAQRKKPRLEVGTFEELSQLGAAAAEKAEADTLEAQEGMCCDSSALHGYRMRSVH